MESAVEADTQVLALASNVAPQQHVEDAAGDQQHAENTTSDQQVEDVAPDNSNHEGAQPSIDITTDEMRSILEVIAATGKFWHEWSFLRSLLSLQLKQVLAEYPEAQTSPEIGPQQNSLAGETYPELVSRLDGALLSFEEGPPFTLQRLCEILLYPKSTYTKLSKLALALEKNLLVTSTLRKCTDPYPTALWQKSEGADPELGRPTENPVPESNGKETVVDDGDEEMPDAEVEEECANQDTEMLEDKSIQTIQTLDAASVQEHPISDQGSSNISAEAKTDGDQCTKPES